jgi:penicillin-binding protein 1C
MFQERLLNIYKRAAAAVRRRPRTFIFGTVLLLAWLCCLPRPLFDAPSSAVLEDRQGNLLGARIAADGQWRFPYHGQVPDKYATCVVAFEDQRFWYHPGIDPVSLLRSLWQNAVQGRVVSGGSTLTMQVIRLSRKNPPRTVWEKCIEVVQATRLELTWRKRSILALYAAHAPFGGNVVGLEAAAWRYYGKQPELLTWAEAATLAVLPNSPALIHPGRNRNALLAKRNRLLDKLRDRGILDATECELAKEEALPAAPLPLPQLAPHLLTRLDGQATGADRRFRCTLDAGLQAQVQEVLTRRQAQYRGNEVHNLAAVIIDVPTGEVLAYVGNISGIGNAYQEHVDVIQAARSTGSILKPYLYALSLESGDILPHSLLQDVPTQLGRYKPENFLESYDGAVPAKRALVRSLNVPFVLLLQQHGLEKFHFELQQLGLTTLHKPPAHYGLSLILGGAEANLLDITNVYACMARRLSAFYERDGRWAANDFRPPVFLPLTTAKRPKLSRQTGNGPAPAAIWHTFEAMQEVERPNSSGEWELFRAGQKIAWKTGTSFGFRDAWAAGVTPRYAVGVWVGNADGEGRPGLIGVEMAAPVLFELFGLLPNTGAWFDPPYDNMTQAAVCRQSGFRVGPHCDPDTVWIPKTGLQAPACPYHQLLHLDAAGQWQVHSDCEAPDQMVHRPWFVLAPVEEFYFKNKHPDYQSPPPFRADCLGAGAGVHSAPMQLIYPRQPTRIYVPVELDGTLGSTVFRVAHRNPDIAIHWHLDGQFLGTTRTFHEMALQPPAGKHLLAVVDVDGNRIEQAFEVIGK